MDQQDLYAQLTVAGHTLVFILALGVLIAHCIGALDCDDGVYARCAEPR